MNIKLETYIAFRYLKSKRKENFISISSFFSFIGITLGVATLIIVMSVMNGFRSELINKIIGVNGSAIIFLKENKKNSSINALTDAIENLPNVEFVSKELEFQAMLNSKKNSSGVIVKGISNTNLYDRSSISDNIVNGNLNDFSNKSVVIGDRLAKYLGVKVGDTITLFTTAIESSPFGSIPISDNFKIVALFDVGMYEFDRGILFMPIEQAKLLQENKTQNTKLEVFLEDNTKLDNTINNINTLIENKGRLLTWKNIHRELFNALKIEKKVMFLILLLIIFVAAFNLISSVTMIVKDKEKAIGILRSLGVNKHEIMRIFMLIGTIVGLVSTFIGSLLGIVISINIGEIQIFLENIFQSSLFSSKIYFFDVIPSQINPKEVVIIILISILLSVFSTIYPALKASKIDPANILRYE